MTLYEYTKEKEPCPGKIREEILSSEMADKPSLNFVGAKRIRNPESGVLQSIVFKIESNYDLSVDDKVILDGIIDNSLGFHKVMQTTRQMLGDLFENCVDQTQQMRLLAALDNRPSFTIALDNQNFPLAHVLMGMSMADGDITEVDVTLIESIVPASKWVEDEVPVC